MRPSPAVLMIAILGLTGTACGDAGESQPRVYEFVVPEGTQANLDSGQDVVIMPSRIELQIGDTLRIRNEDVVAQTVGPYWVPPRKEFEITYGSPGRYEGFCPLSKGSRYEIVVTE